MFREGKLKARDKKTVKEFSEKYIISEKLVANYIEHLSDIEMRKDNRLRDNNRKRTERKQQEYKDIDWEDLYHRNQMSSLELVNLNFILITTTLRVRVVKAHICSKILTSTVQDSQNNIQSASDSNSESDSGRVERIVSSNSSELNDSEDQAADS